MTRPNRRLCTAQAAHLVRSLCAACLLVAFKPLLASADIRVAVDVHAEVDVTIAATWFRGGGDFDCGGNRPDKEDKGQGTRTAPGTMRIDPLPMDLATVQALEALETRERAGARSLAGEIAELHHDFGWVTSSASENYEDVRRVVSELEAPATEGGREWLADARAGHGGSNGARYRNLKAWLREFESTVPSPYRPGVRLPRTDLTTDFGLGWGAYSARRGGITGTLRPTHDHAEEVSVTVEDWINPGIGNLAHSNNCGHIDGTASRSADRMTGYVRVIYNPPPGSLAVLISQTRTGIFDNALDFDASAPTLPVNVEGILHAPDRVAPPRFVAWRRTPEEPIILTYQIRRSRGDVTSSPTLTSDLTVRFAPLGSASARRLSATDIRNEIRRLVSIEPQSREPDRLLDLLLTLVKNPDLVDPMVSALSPSDIYELSDDLFRFEISMSTANPNLTLDTKVAARLVGYQVAKRALDRFAPLCATVSLPLPYAGRLPPRRTGALLYAVLMETEGFLRGADSDPVVIFAERSHGTPSSRPPDGNDPLHSAAVERLAEHADQVEVQAERLASLRVALARRGDYFNLQRLESAVATLATAYRTLSRAVMRGIREREEGTLSPTVAQGATSAARDFRRAAQQTSALVIAIAKRLGFDQMQPDDLASRSLILDAHILNLLDPNLDPYLEPVRKMLVPADELQRLQRQAATCSLGEER